MLFIGFLICFMLCLTTLVVDKKMMGNHNRELVITLLWIITGGLCFYFSQPWFTVSFTTQGSVMQELAL